VLGQTLTTDIGSAGSYAAAQAHNLVREDLAVSDRKRIAEDFNRLAKVWTFYNFGSEVVPPKFGFVKDEDLQTECAERDVKLYQAGVRFKKSYITREYEIPEEDFDFAPPPSAPEPAFQRRIEPRKAACPRGRGGRKDTRNVFQKAAAALFAGKEAKKRARDMKLMDEFKNQILKEGQNEIDKAIEGYVDALGTAHSF